MKLVIPNTYPNQDPLLYICPEKGTKVFPIEGVVDSSGRISPYLTSEIKSMYLIDFFAQLDRYFAVTFPLCVDPTASLIDECKKVMEPEYCALYDEAKQKDAELKQLTVRLSISVHPRKASRTRAPPSRTRWRPSSRC